MCCITVCITVGMRCITAGMLFRKSLSAPEEHDSNGGNVHGGTASSSSGQLDAAAVAAGAQPVAAPPSVRRPSCKPTSQPGPQHPLAAQQQLPPALHQAVGLQQGGLRAGAQQGQGCDGAAVVALVSHSLEGKLSLDEHEGEEEVGAAARAVAASTEHAAGRESGAACTSAPARQGSSSSPGPSPGANGHRARSVHFGGEVAAAAHGSSAHGVFGAQGQGAEFTPFSQATLGYLPPALLQPSCSSAPAATAGGEAASLDATAAAEAAAAAQAVAVAAASGSTDRGTGDAARSMPLPLEAAANALQLGGIPFVHALHALWEAGHLQASLPHLLHASSCPPYTLPTPGPPQLWHRISSGGSGGSSPCMFALNQPAPGSRGLHLVHCASEQLQGASKGGGIGGSAAWSDQVLRPPPLQVAPAQEGAEGREDSSISAPCSNSMAAAPSPAGGSPGQPAAGSRQHAGRSSSRDTAARWSPEICGSGGGPQGSGGGALSPPGVSARSPRQLGLVMGRNQIGGSLGRSNSAVRGLQQMQQRPPCAGARTSKEEEGARDEGVAPQHAGACLYLCVCVCIYVYAHAQVHVHAGWTRPALQKERNM